MKTLRFAALAIALLQGLPTAQCEHLKLTDYNAPPFQGGNNRPDYGSSISIDGDRMAIGISGSSVRGKVELYELDGLNWRLLQVIEAPSLLIGDFGSDVSLSADTLVVADRSRQEVFVYELVGGAWVNTQMLLYPFTTTQFTSFGRAVAVDGDRALVSDWRIATVFVYERDSLGVWSEIGRILDPEGPVQPGFFGPGFGISLAIEGDRAVIGAPLSTAVSGAGGVAYATRYVGPGWEAPTRLDPASVSSYTNYGGDVDISGDKLIVSSLSFGDGYAFVWEDQGTTFAEVACLESSDPENGGGFGTAVAIAGSMAVVGHSGRIASPTTSGAGAGYVFQDLGAGWVETDILVPADRGQFDQIGSVVATNGEMIALNAPGDDDEGPDFGAVYTYSLSGTICPTLQSFPKRISVASGGTFTMLLRPGFAFADQNYIVVGDFTGTAPGFFLDGIFFPLNQDDWFNLVLENPNTFLFTGTQGTLNSQGRGTATFTLPGGLPPGLAGIRFHWAYAIFDAQNGSTLHVSTPVLLRLDV